MLYKTVAGLEGSLEPFTVDEIHKKLGKYFSLTKTYIIEENYIDRWWREEYSIYYSKTFYNKTDKFSTRIHLIKEAVSGHEGVNEDNYIGYLILRPIPVPTSRILKIIVKPLKEAFIENNEKLKIYVAKCKFEVHIGGKKIEFFGFPFYQQDSMVSSCAHADILMVAEYMHRKFNSNKPLIKDFFSNTLQVSGRSVPSPRLTVDQISAAFQNIGIQTKICFPFDSKPQIFEIDEGLNYFLEYVNSYMESGLPTILTVKDHVVLIIGHTINADGKKDYIVYDDSGAFLKKIENSCAFYAVISHEELKTMLKFLIGESYYSVVSINVEFERVYFPYKRVKEVIGRIIKGRSEKIGVNIEDSIKERRFLIADSRDFKILCSMRGVSFFNDILMPHYIWIVELYSESKNIMYDILIDASAHKDDFQSWIAVWYRDAILFNKRYTNEEDKSIYDVKTPPFVYSNLMEDDFEG